MKLLNSKHVAFMKTDKDPNHGRVKLRKMKSLMALVEKYADKEGLLKPKMKDWTLGYAKTIYEKVVVKHLKKYMGGNRANSSSWKTFYNKLQQGGAFKTGHEVVLVSDD